MLIVLGMLLPSTVAVAQKETTGPAKGVLLIHGGGSFNTGEFISLARKSSGKKQPAIVVITTPQGKSRLADFKKGIPYRTVSNLRGRYKMEQVTELYTLSKKEANRAELFKKIDNADAVYICGGNQTYLTDAFLGTETLAAMNRLLERGGVIAGASAGAQVQSSFMTRGDYKKRLILGDRKHQEGFSFVKNSVFDVHVEERNRENHLFQVFKAKKSELQDTKLNPLDLLGIGIDQATAIVVTQDRFKVTGRGQVYIFDSRKWKDDPETWTYQTLKSGTVFDMKLREVIKSPAKMTK